VSNEADIRRLAGQVKAQAVTIKALQDQNVRQKRINDLYSLFDDVIVNVTLWKDYAAAVDREYKAAYDGHTKALKSARQTFQANAAAHKAWTHMMVDLLMFGLSAAGGGAAGKFLGLLVGSKSPGGLLAADGNPVILAAIETFGEDLMKAGAGQLASQLNVRSAADDVFTAVVGGDSYENISFLKPLEIQLNKLAAWLVALKRLKLEERTDMDDMAKKIDAAIRQSPLMTVQPPPVERIQDKFRATLERKMWLLWVLTLDLPYWQRVRAILKMSPEARAASRDILSFSRPDRPIEDVISFEAIRDRMTRSLAFTIPESTFLVRWVPMDTGHAPYNYRAVIFADVIDIAMRELPVAEIPAPLRVQAMAERERARAEEFQKRMNMQSCKVPPADRLRSRPSWQSYLPGNIK
jgi:hypothetical protein